MIVAVLAPVITPLVPTLKRALRRKSHVVKGQVGL